MASGRRYPQELRERAVRMVLEARAEDPGLSLYQAVLRIGPRVGIVPDTLRGGSGRIRSMPVSGRVRRRPSRSGCGSSSGKTAS